MRVSLHVKRPLLSSAFNRNWKVFTNFSNTPPMSYLIKTHSVKVVLVYADRLTDRHGENYRRIFFVCLLLFFFSIFSSRILWHCKTFRKRFIQKCSVVVCLQHLSPYLWRANYRIFLIITWLNSFLYLSIFQWAELTSLLQSIFYLATSKTDNWDST
jgi:hypothetical protein